MRPLGKGCQSECRLNESPFDLVAVRVLTYKLTMLEEVRVLAASGGGNMQLRSGPERSSAAVR